MGRCRLVMFKYFIWRLDHLWVLVPTGVLRSIICGYWGMTVLPGKEGMIAVLEFIFEWCRLFADYIITACWEGIEEYQLHFFLWGWGVLRHMDNGFLAPWPGGIEFGPPAVTPEAPNLWITMEFPSTAFKNFSWIPVKNYHICVIKQLAMIIK